MTLHLHRSERADPLVDALAMVLREPPADPFEPDIVAVPSRGVERWVAQRLSHHLGTADHDGICANVRFPSPRALTSDAVSTALGIDPDEDPWAPHRLVWHVLAVIDQGVDDEWCRPLARHLDDRGRRFFAAQHVAGLFRRYAQDRPTLLQDWSNGDDTDGAGAALPPDLGWQLQLWRRVRRRIGVPGPAERLPDACRTLRADGNVVDLPRRLSLFGPTGLTTEQAMVLSALSEHREVHLWLPHPSGALWDRIEPPGERPRRRTDPTAHVPENRLLASLGRDSREMHLHLATAAGTDTHYPVDGAPTTLLGRVQADLRADRAPTPDHPYDEQDRSLQVHACHGRARQVEVLREVLLGLLESDPSLEPRDVLVMCPDIETYAPLVSATFGLADPDEPDAHPGHRLRVRLADRSLRQTNPVLATVERLLDLADSRVTASQVLDLAASAPVSRRFRLDEDEHERLRAWVEASGIRWGLDTAGRRRFSLHGVPQNTWQAGLDRVLLGVTMSEDELAWLGLALPLDDVDSTDIDLAGRLAELVDRLGHVLGRLCGEHPLEHWLESLSEGMDLLTEVSDRDAWQRAQADAELADVARAAAGEVDLTLADIRTLLADRLQGRPTRAGFRTGHLTMCSMVPMRSVPHRVICLLGLDDGAFPRTAGVDGDDVLARDPLVGERDRRSEDRQLLLDAVLAAREHLVMLYTGADERTNTPSPPAVPLGEILDVVDVTVRSPDGRPARDHLVVRHPLQPFDSRNFTPGVLGVDGPFSFDRTGLDGARAATGPRLESPGFLPAVLGPVAESETVDLDDLIRFLEHPVRAFLRQRLGVAQPEEGEVLEDELRAELDGLQEWSIGDRWLADRLAGLDPEVCEGAEWRRGQLPPGPLGKHVLEQVRTKAEPLVEVGAELLTGPASAIDVAVPLGDRRWLTGTVPGVRGRSICRATYSRLAGKHRVRAWAQLLACAATVPDTQWRAVTIGRGKNPNYPVATSTLTAPGPEAAIALLKDMAALYDEGMCEPLPLPPKASLDFASQRLTGDDAGIVFTNVAKSWDDFERQDADLQRVWGTDLVLHRIVGPGERSRFDELCTRLWGPMLEAET